jgi:hypothetical protein
VAPPEGLVKQILRTALVALTLASAACGKQTFLAAVLLGTPAIPNPVPGQQPFPPQASVIAYLGTIDTSNPTKIDSSKIGFVAGAKAQLAFHSAANKTDTILAVKDRTDGSYSLDSQSNSSFVYEPCALNTDCSRYTLVLTGGDSNEAYGAKLVPTQPVQIQEFHPDQIKSWHAGDTLTITRSDGPDTDGRLLPAFVVVVKVDPQNPGNISLDSAVYTTVPKDATALLKLALSDSDYRKPSFTVPGSTFAAGQNYYVVALLVMKYGAVSENTFLGSTAMTAFGDAGLLVIQ